MVAITNGVIFCDLADRSTPSTAKPSSVGANTSMNGDKEISYTATIDPDDRQPALGL